MQDGFYLRYNHTTNSNKDHNNNDIDSYEEKKKVIVLNFTYTLAFLPRA